MLRIRTRKTNVYIATLEEVIQLKQQQKTQEY